MYLKVYPTNIFIYQYDDNFRKIIHQIPTLGIPALSVMHSSGSLCIPAHTPTHGVTTLANKNDYSVQNDE